MMQSVSSGGFISLSAEVSAQSMKGGIKLTSLDRYRAGGSTKISAEATLDGKPIVGATITWKGAGLYAATTTTAPTTRGYTCGSA
jgi:hypothetical protein